MKALIALLLGTLLILNVPLMAAATVLWIIGLVHMPNAPTDSVPWQAYYGFSWMMTCCLVGSWLGKAYKAVSAQNDAERKAQHAAS